MNDQDDNSKRTVNDVGREALARLARAEIHHGLRPPPIEAFALLGGGSADAPEPGGVLFLPDAGTRCLDDGSPAPPKPNDPAARIQLFDHVRLDELVADGVDPDEALFQAAAEFGRSTTNAPTTTKKGKRK